MLQYQHPKAPPSGNREVIAMKLYRRENYLRKIRGFYHDTGIIKVITGVRRCGKSCLMQTIAEELIRSGIPEENIIYMNLDQRGFRSVKQPEQTTEFTGTAFKPSDDE